MAVSRRRAAGIALIVTANLAAFGFLGFVWVPQWRRRVISNAMRSSRPPAFWWPPAWRRALQTSFLLEGSVIAREGSAKRAATGLLELESDAIPGGVFRTPLDSTGRFSFGDQLLPVGPFQVRIVAPDGSRSRSIRAPEIDSGPHRLNWSF